MFDQAEMLPRGPVWSGRPRPLPLPFVFDLALDFDLAFVFSLRWLLPLTLET
jgi:hypothetical protein